MKSLIALLLAIFLLPTAAMGFESLDDPSMHLLQDKKEKEKQKQEQDSESNFRGMQQSSMQELTGQAGVKINFDDIKLYQNVEGLWYTDTDGTENGDAASVGIKEMSANIQINSIYYENGNIKSPGSTGVQGDYSGYSMGSFTSSPLTIDVSDNLSILDSAGIKINLPTVEIHQSSMTVDLAVHNDANPLDNTGTTNSFGKVGIGESSMVITDGTVEIAPH